MCNQVQKHWLGRMWLGRGARAAGRRQGQGRGSVGYQACLLWAVETHARQDNDVLRCLYRVPLHRHREWVPQPEGLRLPQAEGPRVAAVEGKQQQWSLSVSSLQPFSPISTHSKQQFSRLQPLSQQAQSCLNGGLGQEEGCHSRLGKAWVAKRLPFFSPLSLVKNTPIIPSITRFLLLLKSQMSVLSVCLLFPCSHLKPPLT